MTNRLKIKIAALIAVAAIGLVAMGALLTGMQTDMLVEGYQQEMDQEAAELPTLLQEAADETEQNTETFDAIYQSKAESVAFMANNNAGFEATNAKMAEYRELLGVSNVLVVNRAGDVVAQAAETHADFSHARFNQLRTTFTTGEPSPAVDVELPEQNWDMRYYAAAIDDDTMVVVEQDPTELDELIEDTGSVAAVLKNISVGQHGYVFAVSARDYLVTYHPDGMLVGADAIDRGLPVESLEDGTSSWIDFDGERLYCHVALVDDTYYLLTVPESDMAASRNITAGVTLFVFFAVMVAIILYGVFVLHEEERRRRGEEVAESEDVEAALAAAEAAAGPDANIDATGVAAAIAHDANAQANAATSGITFNRRIGRKAAVLSLVGLIAVVGVTFYMQTLFALSSESVTNNERVSSIEQTMRTAEDRAAALTDQYSERYLSKARTGAYIIDQNPSLASDRAKLQELADVLQIQYVFTFDAQGNLVASNSTFVNFSLSDDPSSQSYDFRKLLQGVSEVVQDPMNDEVTGELRQYIGVALHDADGLNDGFLQIGIRPERLQKVLESVQIDRVLDGVKVGTDGFAFAVNKADNTLAYYPDENLVGKSVLDLGMTEGQLKDGFCDYLTVGDNQYYASSGETNDYYVYAAGSEGELMAERGPLTLTVGAVALACFVVIFLMLSFERKRAGAVAGATVAGAADDAAAAAGAGVERMIDVEMPSGRRAKTESAASRWLNKSLKWSEKSAEQKTVTIIGALAAVSVVVVCLAVLFQDRIFDNGSIFSYILGGGWERGLNIFAVTAALMSACVILTVAVVIQQLLNLLSSVLDARGETVCRLLGSFIKYGSIIGVIYYCLALLGVDTTTLLASAGILSIAISLGAKDLVADILSGLFIIFEGEFRVGDIITLNGWRGTVLDIGVRTTKVQDGSQNIKVVRNSEVSNVINMTKRTSYASCDVGIEYGESLERVENILEKELPNIRKRLPAILDGPFYKGVVSLGDNSVNIRIVVQCTENDRMQLERDLNREMKLLFDKYDVSIPFPQVVINKPTVHYEATEAEKAAADRFNDEQKIAASKIGNDEDDDFEGENERH